MLTEPATTPMEPVVSLSEAGQGAVVALLRVVELHDPAIAHRAALRSVVAARIARDVGAAPGEQTAAIAAAALADIDRVLAPKNDGPARHDDSQSILIEALTDRLPGLNAVADALRHHLENWDGTGVPSELAHDRIPLPSRIVATSDQVVGEPAPGFLPSWETSLKACELQAGSRLDPELVASLRRIDLPSIEAAINPSAVILDLLDRANEGDAAIAVGSAATDIATAVTSASRIDDLLELFADIARRAIGAANVSILLLTQTSIDEIPIAKSADDRTPPLDNSRLDDLGEFSAAAELRAGVPVRRSTADVDPAIAGRLRSMRVGSEISVPILLGSDTWAILSAASRIDDRQLDDHDLSVLRHVAHQASIALASTFRWAEIEGMALRDQLTGLANRHVLNAVLDEIFLRDPVDRQDCAVIMCDVDGLKAVNDAYGHGAGDDLLTDAATALRGAIRDPERTTVCRIGGDEFCLVIDGGALLTAHDIAETIERLFERSGGGLQRRSISCGIAFATVETESRSDLLRAADQNQYQTKRSRKLAKGEPLPDHARSDGDRRAIRD